MRSLIAMVCWGDPHVNSDSHNQFLACFRDWQSRLWIDFGCQKLLLIRLLATSYLRLVWNHFCPPELILSCLDLILADQNELGFDILKLITDVRARFWAEPGCILGVLELILDSFWLIEVTLIWFQLSRPDSEQNPAEFWVSRIGFWTISGW